MGERDMEMNFIEHRSFKYLIIAGLAIIFWAILMIFFGTNAEAADIYVDDNNVGGPWDGSMANPYQNITSAIANSNPTDNIYVWDGSYNENLTIDKSIQLIGNGSATTIIDGFGTMNNIINITAHGVEVTGFNFMESGMWYGIWTNEGGFNIHDNVFEIQNYAIYMDIYRLYSDSTVIGDIIVDNNEVVGTDGFFFNIEFRKPLMGSNLILNQTIITNNKLYNTNTGIRIEDYAISDAVGGSIDWGDIIINDNLINSGNDNGIYFWGWVVNMTDVDVSLGNLNVSGNNITSDPTGIHFLSWNTIDIFGSTVVTTQDTRINNNTIVSQYYNGITHYTSYLFYLYDSASVTTGDFFLYSNNITTVNPVGQEGICIYIIGVGQFMYNDSSVDFGNMYIDSNIVNSNNYGIYISYEDSFGTDTYDKALVNAGDVHVINNEIISANNSIYLSFNRIGYNMHDQSNATLGSYHISSNNITFSNNNGIYLYAFNMASSMNNDTSFSMGDLTVNNNTINSTTNIGIHFDMQNTAHIMTGNATVTFSNFLLNDNVVNSTDNGIYIYFYAIGHEMYGNSHVYFSHIQLNDNTITCNDSHAIYIAYFSDIGFIIEGNSYFEMGNFEIRRNSIVSNGSGIYSREMGFLGNYLTETSVAVFGDFIIEDNTMNVSNDGIIFDVYDWGETLSGSSSVTFGDISISNNIIESGNKGIYFQFDPAAYDMHDMAIFEMGSIRISNNTILSGKDPASVDSYGISFWTRSVGYDMHNETQAIMGSILVNDNNVTVLFGTNADGIYIYRIALYGYNMYDTASFTMNGNIEVCRNIIHTLDRDSGIFCDVHDLGSYLYGDNTASYGNFLFNDNVINSTGEGIHIDSFQNNAYYVYGSSLVVFGNIEINRNDIIAANNSVFAEYGIYFYFLENAYMMFNDSIAYFGHIQINDNNVTSKTYHAIHIGEFYYIGVDMHNDAYFEMGNFEIKGNQIEADDDGVNIYEFAYIGYDMYDNSTAVLGDFIIADNIINCSEGGIYLQAYEWGSDMNDNSSFSMGDWIINTNIIQSGDDGIYFDPWNFGYNNFDYSISQIGNNEIMHNEINSSRGIGIYTQWWYRFGGELSENAYVEVGYCYIMNNEIWTNSTFEYGIECRPFRAGYYVNDDSQAYFGDYIVSNNEVYTNCSGGSAGIWIKFQNIGEYLEPSVYPDTHAIVEVGNILVNNNTITAPNDYGLLFYYYEVAARLYGNSTVTIGFVQIFNNTIRSSDEAISVDLYWVGYEIHDDAQAFIGPFEIDENNVNSTDDIGIYISMWRCAHAIRNNAQFSWDGIYITNNDITAGSEGIDFGIEGSVNVSGNSIVDFPGLWVTGNTVDAELGAFNYTTETTPLIVGPVAAFNWGDVVIEDNILYSGVFGMAFDWQDPILWQPEFFINHCDIMLGSDNSTGLYMNNINDTYIETLTIDGYDQGVSVNNSNIWFMFNSTITKTPSSDLNLSSNSFIGAVNCSFNKTNVNFEDNSSLLRVGWFMNVLVKNQIGNTVPEANLTVTDAYGSEIYNGTTDSLGLVRFLIAWQYEENITGVIDNFNNHTADANKGGIFGSSEENMTRSKLVIVVLIDPSPPDFFDNATDTLGTTGDIFDFIVNVDDNLGVQVVHVNYRLGSIGPFTNLSMIGAGPYWIGVTLPTDYVGTLEYYFAAQDVSEQWRVSHNTTVPVVDNDKPTNLDDTSDTQTTTGGDFTFRVNATDNIEVTEAHVVWWFGTAAPTNDTMIGTGPYTFTIATPSDSEVLHYYFTITDAAGKWLVGPQVDVDVLDDDAPTLVSDDSDTEATLGGQFAFSADITDNIGVTEAYVIYWFDSEPETNVSMEGTGPYTKTIDVPSEVSSLHYYFKARDAAGRWFVGSQVDVIVSIDDVPPTLISDDSDTEATTGDDFDFEVTITDNVGVTEAHVVHWFGSGTETNSTMTGSGTYTLTITVPSNSLDLLHYYFTATDDAGKWFVGSQVNIPVLDNDKPYDIVDGSQTTATTGDDFTFSFEASDNIGVMGAEIFYWFGDDSPTTQTLTGAGPFTYTITAPSNSLDALHYYFILKDAATNQEQTTQVDITVTDNDPGTLSNEGSDISGEEGGEFLFQTDGSDNIDVSEVKVAYWFGDDESQKKFLTLSETDGTYSGSITLDESGTLHYYYVISDLAGNDFESSEQTVTISLAVEPSEPDEEINWLTWILIIILVVILILILFFLLKRRKKEEEELPDEVEEEVPRETVEEDEDGEWEEEEPGESPIEDQGVENTTGEEESIEEIGENVEEFENK